MSRRKAQTSQPLAQSQIVSHRHNLSLDEVQDATRYKQCLLRLSKVMDVVQSDEYAMGGKKGKTCEKLKAKLMKQMKTIFEQSGLKVFSETLMRMMVVPFQAKESNNPYISRIIEFFFDVISDSQWIDEDFSNSPELNTTVNSTNSSVLEDGSDPLPVRMLKLCEKYHTESRALIRLRLMQTVEKIIPDVVEVEKLGRALQMKLIRMLNTRRKDKNDQVRAIALRNLCYFYQDGMPFYDQVEDGLLHHMCYDPVPSVRLQVVLHIPINDKLLEIFVERTGDPNDSVRAASLNRVAKDIPLDKLPLQLRENILKANTSEDNPKIIQKALNGLLKEWLSRFEEDPCEFLRILNVRRRRKLCRSALDTLYSEASEEAFEKMSKPLLNDKKYPEDSLCVESTFLWLYMYTRFHEEAYIMKKLIIPVGEMIEYITEFVDVVEEEGNLSPGDLAYRSWMLGDMLQILTYLPVEEGERQAILSFLPELFVKKKLMDTRNSCLGVKLISVCSNIQEETCVIDLVNTILDSDRDSTRKSRSRSKTPKQQFNLKDEPEDDNMEGLEDLKRELGLLVHRSRKLERDRDVAATGDDLYRAQECQDAIRQLEVEINQLKTRITAQEHAQSFSSMVEDEDDDEPWPYTDSTMLITMTMVKENIEQLNKISDFSRTFYEMYALKAVAKTRDPAIRALALELMCIIALEHEGEANKAASYCLSALLRDDLIVKVSALKGLYDLVLKYSFAQLAAHEQVQRVLNGMSSNGDSTVRSDPDSATTLKTLMFTYIRHDELALVKVSVAGSLKLLFKREVNFSRIITSFLTHWAIPSHETRLRFKDVGVLVPLYATMGESEAIEVSECLLHCIEKTLQKMHSGRRESDNQLPFPDLDQIANLIVKATHPSKLVNFQRPYIGHQTIAVKALEKLHDVDLVTDEKVQYAKLLKVLELKDCQPDTIKQMIHSVAEIAETNRRIGSILSGFSKYLESMVDDTGDAAEGGEQRSNNDDDDVPASAFENEQDDTMMSDTA